MRTMKHGISRLIAIGAFAFCALGLVQEAEAQNYYTLSMDCRGTNGIPNWSETGSEINIQFRVNDTWINVKPNNQGVGNGSIPNSWCDGENELGGWLGYAMALGMVEAIKITNYGNDAFWVDEMKLTWNATGQWWSWGVDNNSGYCLSSDTTDNYAECWNGVSYKSITFTM